MNNSPVSNHFLQERLLLRKYWAKAMKRTILTRHRKAGKDRIQPAAGHSIKLHFQAAADDRFRKSVGESLSDKFIRRYNEQLKK